MEGTWCFCQQKDYVTVEHHYHFNIVNVVIDFQLTELKARFQSKLWNSLLQAQLWIQLMSLNYLIQIVFVILLRNFILMISVQMRFLLWDKSWNNISLMCFLIHFFRKVTSLYELCRRLIEIKKSQHYFLIDRLIHLMLTIPVSTTTTESVFSAMSLIKISLRSKMKNKFLSDYMVVYTEKEITNTIDLDCIID